MLVSFGSLDQMTIQIYPIFLLNSRYYQRIRESEFSGLLWLKAKLSQNYRLGIFDVVIAKMISTLLAGPYCYPLHPPQDDLELRLHALQDRLIKNQNEIVGLRYSMCRQNSGYQENSSLCRYPSLKSYDFESPSVLLPEFSTGKAPWQLAEDLQKYVCGRRSAPISNCMRPSN